MAPFVIRNLQYEDIPALIRLPEAEGREMGREAEVKSWLEIDPHGIFIAESAEDGQIVGSCSAIALSAHHGYIGMYVVGRKYRGIGLGRFLWNAAISRLGDRNISLSSAEKMLPFYQEKAGFSLSADWTVDLYTATTVRLPSDPLVCVGPTPYLIVVDPLSPFIQCVINYDASLHKYDRSEIVKATVSEVDTLTLMAVKRSTDDCKTSGYACMKKSLQGHWLLAPVYADDYESAYALIYGLLNNLTDNERREGVVAKLISSNYEAAKVFLQFGMKRTNYQLKRLFTKEIFQIPENNIFALQSSVFCTE